MPAHPSSPYARFAAVVHDHPGRVLAVLALLLAVAVQALLSLKPMDVSIEGLLGENAAENQRYDAYKQLFGSDEVFLLLVQADDVLAEPSLRRLKALHHALETGLPQAEQVASLANTPHVSRNGTHATIGTLLEPWPADAADLARRTRALAAAPYYHALVNTRRDLTPVMIRLRQTIDGPGGPEPLHAGHYRQITAELERIADAHRAPGFRIQVLGQAATLGALQGMLIRDIYVLPLAALAASMLTLLLLFQRASGVLIPALVIVMPVTLSFALMAIAGFPVQLPTALLPPFLVVMSVAGTVHLLSSFYRHFATPAERRAALLAAFADKGPALLMTSLTTAAGLASFAFAEVSPIANLGIFGAIGTLLALLSTLVVFPLYVRLAPMQPLPDGQREVGGMLRAAFRRLIDGSAGLACTHPGKIILLALLLMALASGVAANLRFAHNYLNWLPQEWALYTGARQADAEFNAGVSVEILLDSGRANGVADPAFIARLQQLQHSLRTMDHKEAPVGLLVSVDDYLAQIRGTLDDDNRDEGNRDEGHLDDDLENSHAAYGNDPGGQRRLQRDLRLLQLTAPELLHAMVTPDLRQARISIRTGLHDAGAYRALMADIRQRTATTIGDSYPVSITGQVAVMERTLAALSSSATQSYLLSTAIILAMMVVFLRSVRDGLWSLLPNLLPVLIVLAGMELFAVDLDIFTMLVVSIALGLVVDDTIHFITHFRRNLDRGGDARRAVHDTLGEIGGAMIISTLVLVLGVQFLHLSELGAVGTFGMLTSAIMLLGLAADFLVAPAIMVWLYGRTARQAT